LYIFTCSNVVVTGKKMIFF